MYLTEGNVLRHRRREGTVAGPRDARRDAADQSGDDDRPRAARWRRRSRCTTCWRKDTSFRRVTSSRSGMGHRTVVATPLYREGHPFGVHPAAPERGAPVHRSRDRAAADVRRPGGDRDRERPPVQRDQGGARPAARVGRGAARRSAARSPTRQPVFDTILDELRAPVRGQQVGIDLVGDDGLVHLGALPRSRPRRSSSGVCPHSAVDDEPLPARAIFDAKCHPCPRRRTPKACRAHAARVARRFGIQARCLSRRMLWEGRGIGAILVGARLRRARSRDKEIALLKTFADQAVIAIQNARLVQRDQGSARPAARVRRGAAPRSAARSPTRRRSSTDPRELRAPVRRQDGRDRPRRRRRTRPSGRLSRAQSGRSSRRVYPHTVDSDERHRRPRSRRVSVSISRISTRRARARARRRSTAFGIRAAIVAPMLWEGKGIGASGSRATTPARSRTRTSRCSRRSRTRR